MNKKEELRKALSAMMKGHIPTVTTWGKCKSVSGQKCSVTIDELDIDDISLGAPNSSVVVYPKTNSNVLVMFTDNTNTVGVILYAEEADKIELMGNANGGLAIVSEVQNNLDELKNYVTTLTSAVAAGLSAVGAGSAANGATGAAQFNTDMSSASITFSNMENTKVNHGNG